MSSALTEADFLQVIEESRHALQNFIRGRLHQRGTPPDYADQVLDQLILGAAHMARTFCPGGVSPRSYVFIRAASRCVDVGRDFKRRSRKETTVPDDYWERLIDEIPAGLAPFEQPTEGRTWERGTLFQEQREQEELSGREARRQRALFLLSKLPERVQAMMWEHFGRGWPLRQVGRQHGVSHPRVAAILATAMQSLRAALGVKIPYPPTDGTRTRVKSVREGLPIQPPERIHYRETMPPATNPPLVLSSTP